MSVESDGVLLTLVVRDEAKIPADSKIYVHNLSAVGEQYLDFEPADDGGPYVGEGDLLKGGPESLPVSEEQLLLDLDDFVASVDQDNLRTLVREAGTMFRGTGPAMQRLIDSGDQILTEARAVQPETLSLIRNSVGVLRTQREQGSNLVSFSRDLADVAETLKANDRELRDVLQGGQPAARQFDRLLESVEPTMPLLLGNLVTVSQVVATRLPATEQLLVSFPVATSTAFSAVRDGALSLNLQLDYDTPACTQGYVPTDEWRPTDDETDGEVYPARCDSGAPYNVRGTKHAPRYGSAESANRVAAYDPASGAVATGAGMTVGGQGGTHALFGKDSWKWLLIGPTT
jgi:phospholipid/cholesterol/gamma-HCH transport system substrate-binding protein